MNYGIFVAYGVLKFWFFY